MADVLGRNGERARQGRGRATLGAVGLRPGRGEGGGSGRRLGTADRLKGLDTRPATRLDLAGLTGRAFCVRSQDGRDLAIVRLLSAAPGDGPVRLSVDYYRHGDGFLPPAEVATGASRARPAVSAGVGRAALRTVDGVAAEPRPAELANLVEGDRLPCNASGGR
ncbi:hypothetical protein [Kitasatospora sp. NPDC085879]|uniref:hypothetical protein n=1 Tax=Kitasatospora sp. NPDC085879 TaxID=3154769 RepID=UPI00341EBCC7